MHEKSDVATMIARLTDGVTRSVQESGLAKRTQLHREIVQGMPTSAEQDVRVLFATFLPGDVTPRHSHRFPVTVYMLEGRFTHLLDGRAPVEFAAGEVFVEPSSVARIGRNKGEVLARIALYDDSTPDTPLADPAIPV